MLALEAAMIGVFISLDLFLFYVFWDAMLIPMYFLIGIWGYDRRIYAAIKFLVYTMAGSVLMLLAILGLAYMHSTATGSYSFDLLKLYDLQIAPATQVWFFLAFALAFAIKVPLFPFHTWLPDAHVQAPTAGSVILAGVRTSVIINIGTATIASTVGASTLGTPIIIGLSGFNTAYVIQGALLVALAAIIADRLFERLVQALSQHAK